MSDKPIIDDPLARFLGEEDARSAGIKNPQTGIRESVEKVQQRANQEEYAKRKLEVWKRFIISNMHDDNNREALYDLLNTCHVFDIPFAEIPQFNNGEIKIGKLIEADMKRYSIKQYCKMIEEGTELQGMFNADAASQ